VVAQLMYQQLLSLDFGITVYATNVYLKACPRALQQLRAGARTVAMAARRQGQQQVSGAAAGTMAACGALLSCARPSRFGAAFTALGGGLPGCDPWVCRPARQVRPSTCWPCRPCQARWANLPACLAAEGQQGDTRHLNDLQGEGEGPVGGGLSAVPWPVVVCARPAALLGRCCAGVSQRSKAQATPLPLPHRG
jgi:hypothetical protein